MKKDNKLKKDSIFASVYVIFEVIMEVIIPLLMASIIDNGVEKGDISDVVIMGCRICF